MEYEEELERVTEEKIREKEKVVAEIKNSIQESIKEEVEKRRAYADLRCKARQNGRIKTRFICRKKGHITKNCCKRKD